MTAAGRRKRGSERVLGTMRRGGASHIEYCRGSGEIRSLIVEQLWRIKCLSTAAWQSSSRLGKCGRDGRELEAGRAI